MLRPVEDEYVRDFVRSMIGTPDTTISRDMCGEIFRLLAGTSEVGSLAPEREGASEEQLRPAIWRMLAGSGVPPAKPDLAFWPESRPFAVCLTHDVDCASHRQYGRKFLRRFERLFKAAGSAKDRIRSLAAAAVRMAQSPFVEDDLGGFDRWLAEEERLGFHSTWYFLPQRPLRPHVLDPDYGFGDAVSFAGRTITVAAMMKEIDWRGHEVGLHASYLSGPDPVDLAYQRTQVERAVGKPVISVRHHYLRFDVMRSPAAQVRAGVCCDSSLGYAKSIGFRHGVAHPFLVWDHENRIPSTLLEIPLTIMDGPLMEMAGGAPDRAIEMATDLLREVRDIHGCLTLNWHPNHIALPGYIEVYRTIIEEVRALGGWGCTARDVHEWWTKRRLGINQ